MRFLEPSWLLCSINLLFMAALPRLFFRPGRLNRKWWLTAAPFLMAGAGLVLHALRPGGVMVATLHALPGLVAVPLAAGSIALIGFTLGSHRDPVSLWHQEHDTPVRIVRHGAYARIRHPFYAAFLLALAACALAAPGVLTITALPLGLLRLNQTAAREERRLLDSPLGAEYRDYVRGTGRFLPRLQASLRVPERT